MTEHDWTHTLFWDFCGAAYLAWQNMTEHDWTHTLPVLRNKIIDRHDGPGAHLVEIFSHNELEKRANHLSLRLRIGESNGYTFYEEMLEKLSGNFPPETRIPLYSGEMVVIRGHHPLPGNNTNYSETYTYNARCGFFTATYEDFFYSSENTIPASHHVMIVVAAQEYSLHVEYSDYTVREIFCMGRIAAWVYSQKSGFLNYKITGRWYDLIDARIDEINTNPSIALFRAILKMNAKREVK